MLKDTDITIMQRRVLKYKMTYPEKSQIADISEFFDVSHTSMVHVVKSLEKKGYVIRQPIRRRRGMNILLIEQERNLVEANEERIEAVEKIVTRDFIEEEKQELLSMLKKMNENLEQVKKKEK